MPGILAPRQPRVNPANSNVRPAGRPLSTSRGDGFELSGPKNAGEVIDLCIFMMSLLEARKKSTLAQVLDLAYRSLFEANKSPAKRADLFVELHRRGFDPTEQLEHALAGAIFKPSDRSEQVKVDKYARALKGLARRGVTPNEAKHLLRKPGIEVLAGKEPEVPAADNAPKAPKAPAKASKKEGAGGGRRMSVSFTPDLLEQLQAAPDAWLPALVLLRGPDGIPVIGTEEEGE